MEEDNFPSLSANNVKKTYQNTSKLRPTAIVMSEKAEEELEVAEKHPLTTKNAMKFLLEGNLKTKVCRYCLNMVPLLSELDQILNIAGSGTMYKVTIRDIVESFHPVKVADDPNFPNKICDKCLNRAISSYLFSQQCERAERALHNCFIDIYEKVNKLDPLERTRKRGRHKLNPNYNVIHAEHDKVIDYAEPIINIINRGTQPMSSEPVMTELECTRCWQVLPNMESLLKHEKSHPNTMWFHCRLCGKSFPKRTQMKKHYHRVHVLGIEPKVRVDNDFRCIQCKHVTDNYKQHLLHVEKHKFKIFMEQLVEKKMDKICTVCLDKSDNLMDLEDMVCIHGGCPELMGDKPLYNILASTLPGMNDLQNLIGTKVCNKCLNNAITSYIFINQFSFARERLDTCISHMLKNLENVQTNANLFVQINENTVMPFKDDFDESLLLNENDYIDESKLKSDILEDEFRVKSESDTESEVDVKPNFEESTPFRIKFGNSNDSIEDFSPQANFYTENPAKNVTKTYSKNKLVNGLHTTQYTDLCSEFLTFNKREHLTEKRKCRFTCQLCSKNFITDYFLKRHIVKHMNKKLECNLCNKEFKSKFYLFEHTKAAHLLKLRNYFSCKVCGRTFIKEDKFISHEKQHTMIECQLCYKIYGNQTNFNSHMQRHSAKLNRLKQKRAQTCSFCEKECLNDKRLSLHVNKVHFEIKPYSCDMCDKQFYVENNLRHHKKVHSMKTNEICQFCNKSFKCRKSLVTHVRKHMGVKPFNCHICGESFYSQFKATKHMEVCHGGRYCCSVCKITFMTKVGLKNHAENEHRFV